MKIEKQKSYFQKLKRLAAVVGLAFTPFATNAAGILTPVNSTEQPVQLESHHVRVVINNGFARTEVEQVFYNPNAYELEAIYEAPVPEHGALSELTIWAGERVLQGEVVSKEDADLIYEEEKNAGNSVGKASQDSYQNFEFTVYPVPANGSVRMRYVYYEPLSIDTGVGRYTYRLEEGGTDEEAEAFWSLSNVVEADVSVEVLLKSAWPIANTRTPNFDGSVETIDGQTLRYLFSSQGGQLDQDFVFYYMLEKNLPGRVEMLTYRESEDKVGTFMLVMTPGADLQPLTSGADYVFALDVSGSMQGKLHTLISGVKKAIEQLNHEDRFRIVAFNNSAWDVTRNWVQATPEGVQQAFADVDGLQSNGGTNVYEGVELSMARMDGDRVSSLILVTDGVTNQGIVDPAKFYKLLHGQDVRFFGFLLGNSSNWPLMELMSDASGGHYRAVSNSDDIIGEILIAKNKITHESMHHAELSISGVKTFDVSNFELGKIHYGDQLVLFGRYEKGGTARVQLKARISGEDKVYETDIEFPDTDKAHPELERMWALDQIQKIEINEMAGFVNSSEAAHAVRDIGIAYQIVTNETSMIALDDETFARRGMERRNEGRIAREVAAAQANPSSSGAKRVDANKPMYKRKSHSVGGGGAVEPWMFCLVLAGGLGYWMFARKKLKSVNSVVAAGIVLFAAGSVSELRADESSSIDRSIASFWEVSEEEARVPVKATAAKAKSPVMIARKHIKETDTHKVHQTRNKKNNNGHFGFKILDGISIFDFVWGDKHESESDEYSGTVKR